MNGARKRLDRADENIQQLNREIIDLLAPFPVITFRGPDPVFTDSDRKAFEELKNLIFNGTVGKRFGLLAGEIIHHLRSAFDHLVWQLTSSEFQAKPAASKVEFPIFDVTPKICGITRNKMCRYCRKVEGIASPTALARIHGLQPYLRADPARDPLWLIHDMDRIDKHRVLLVAVHTMNLNIVASLSGIGYQMPWERQPRVGKLSPMSQMEMEGKMSPQIAFSELARREDQAIIPTLQSFLRFTSNAIESFADEFV
ncbi:MAG: hypothetical protein ACRD3L_10545 [Terriglobales bacterium]